MKNGIVKDEFLDIASGVISEVIEEQRIKPTVIRRRKKIKRIEPAIPAAEAEEKAEVVEPETPSEVAGAEIPKEVEAESVTEAVPLGEGGPEEETLEEEISVPPDTTADEDRRHG